MPPVKKPPKNAFSFYMDDFIPDLVAKGIRINHKEEAVKHLLPEWKELRKELNNVIRFFKYIDHDARVT
jgi:hypothetical protein